MTKTAALTEILSHDANEGSPESLYEIHGDTAAALEAYSAFSQPGQRQEYNRLLLSYLSSSSSSSPSALGDLTEQMDEWEKNWKDSDEFLSVRKKKVQKFIIAYNRALLHFASRKPRHAAGPLLDLLRPVVADTKTTLTDDLLDVLARSAFLVLDCILAISEGRNLQEFDEVLTCESLVTWLDSLDFESMPNLKFLLALYKSRLDLAARDESGKMIDPKVRSVRKELKLAMEVLNQKLRPALTGSTVGECASVRSLSDVEGPSIHTTDVPISHQESLLQGLNESALNLKAHYEELKGNSKKSLILCAEARSSSDESIHLNNLAIVYAANGKRNLALHSCARSLRASSSIEKVPFASNGTARPEPTWSKVHNAAILAFRAGNYVPAYECMANCVQNSKEYSERPKCWLRMAEACIGIYNESKKKREEERNQMEFVAVESNGQPNGVLLSSSLDATPLFVPQELNDDLGSPNDVDQVSKQPLGRAFICLERVIGFQHANAIDKDCLESARCSLAYLKLELRDFQGAADVAISVLLENDEVYWQKTGGLRDRLHKQRLACVRLYLSEALSTLGNSTSAMRLISQDDDSSFMNQLSVDLAGGILPNIDVNDVSKLLKAQIMVQTNASSVAASMGDLSVAEQLALSALQTSEESLRGSTSKTASYIVSARKALLFCMLREGNREGALELLASAW